MEIKTFINREDGILAEIIVDGNIQRLRKENTLVNDEALAYASYSTNENLVCFIFAFLFGLSNVVIYDMNKARVVSNIAMRNAIASTLYKDKLVVLATEDGEDAVDAFYYITTLTENERGAVDAGKFDQFYLGVKLTPGYDRASCCITVQDGIILCNDLPSVSIENIYDTPNAWHYDRMLTGDRYPEKDSIYMSHILNDSYNPFSFRRNCFFQNPDYAAGAIKHIIMPEFIGMLKEREYNSEFDPFRDGVLVGEYEDKEQRKQDIKDKIDEIISACNNVFNSTERSEKIQFIRVATEKYNCLMEMTDNEESYIVIFDGIDDFIKNSNTSLENDAEFMDICQKGAWSGEDKAALAEMLNYGEFGTN